MPLDGVELFHDWIDYYGVAFLKELLEWCRTFSGFQGSENSGMKGFKKKNRKHLVE